MENILQKIYRYIKDNNLISEGDRVLVSASAGKDSMALLHILYTLRKELNITIGLYHLDHMMRGEESYADLLFVLQESAKYGVSAFIERYDFTNRSEKGKSFEEQARDYRYARLQKIAQEYGYTKIATAHTKNDQIETVLMRIFQGTGLLGLQGIPVKRETIIRPLLVLSQNAVYEYLNSHGLLYRHDRTNDDVYYLRNYIRHNVIPVVKERFPHYDDALINLQKQAYDATQSIHDMMQQLYPDCIKVFPDYIQVEEKAIAHSEYIFKFYCAYIISNYLKKYVDTDILDAVYRARFSRKRNLTLFEGKGIHIYRRFRNNTAFLLFSVSPLVVGDSNYEYTLLPGETVTIKEAGISVHCTVAQSHDMQSGSTMVALRHTGCDNIIIRNKREGDAIVRKTGRRTLKRLYIDYKLTPEQKKMLPLIVIDNKVAAILFDVVVQQKPEISLPFLPQDDQKMLVIHYWPDNNVTV